MLNGTAQTPIPAPLTRFLAMIAQTQTLLAVFLALAQWIAKEKRKTHIRAWQTQLRRAAAHLEKGDKAKRVAHGAERIEKARKLHRAHKKEEVEVLGDIIAAEGQFIPGGGA